MSVSSAIVVFYFRLSTKTKRLKQNCQNQVRSSIQVGFLCMFVLSSFSNGWMNHQINTSVKPSDVITPSFSGVRVAHLFDLLLLSYYVSSVFYVRQAIKTAVRDLVLHGSVSQTNRPSIINGVRFYDCCSNINCRLIRSKKASNINFTWILTDFS